MTLADQRVPVVDWSTPSILVKRCASARRNLSIKPQCFIATSAELETPVFRNGDVRYQRTIRPTKTHRRLSLMLNCSYQSVSTHEQPQEDVSCLFFVIPGPILLSYGQCSEWPCNVFSPIARRTIHSVPRRLPGCHGYDSQNFQRSHHIR